MTKYKVKFTTAKNGGEFYYDFLRDGERASLNEALNDEIRQALRERGIRSPFAVRVIRDFAYHPWQEWRWNVIHRAKLLKTWAAHISHWEAPAKWHESDFGAEYDWVDISEDLPHIASKMVDYVLDANWLIYTTHLAPAPGAYTPSVVHEGETPHPYGSPSREDIALPMKLLPYIRHVYDGPTPILVMTKEVVRYLLD